MPESEIAHLRSVLTVLEGRIVYGQGSLGPLALDAPKAMPHWSPVANFGGHWRRHETVHKMASACRCASSCSVHGYDHATALDAKAGAGGGRPELLGRLGMRLLGRLIGQAPSKSGRRCSRIDILERFI